jgi:hypothetical protein
MGDWGYLILQIGITIAVILALTAAVYWLVRRYSSIGLGGIGRGRVPRLAVVDALTVDRRRRLLLVRRDNVEHLILIGGPSDVVVEQTIQRARSRPRQPAPAPAVSPEAAVLQELAQSGLALDQPPLPPTMNQAEPEPAAPSVPPAGDNVERFAFGNRPPQATAYRSDRRQGNQVDARQLLEAIETKATTGAFAGQSGETSALHQPASMAAARELRVVSSEPAREAESGPPVTAGVNDSALTKISDLEQEMARLLGQLNVKRPS